MTMRSDIRAGFHCVEEPLTGIGVIIMQVEVLATTLCCRSFVAQPVKSLLIDNFHIHLRSVDRIGVKSGKIPERQGLRFGRQLTRGHLLSAVVTPRLTFLLQPGKLGKLQ